ncbi:MAG: hypothetical protein SangKO_010450 [Sandaracinaceae bacterium]
MLVAVRRAAAAHILGAAAMATTTLASLPAAGAQTVLTSTVRDGQPPVESRDEDGSPSRSVGVPDRGRLRDSVQLEPTPHLFIRESRRSAQYGTAELVGLVQRAAARVSIAHPGPRLVVGDLSRERGGRVHPHRSHRTGRDADLGFYLLDEEGAPVEVDRFVNLRRSGCGRVGEARYCFDPARNWDLVAALVSDPTTSVQYILVAPDIRRRLMEEGERRSVDPALLERVRIATEPHRGSRSHRSHFHVRIYCPVDDRPECVDEPPYHAWYEGEPAPATPGIRRMRARQRRAYRRQAARQRARAQRRAQRRARQRRAQRARRRARRARQRARE